MSEFTPTIRTIGIILGIGILSSPLLLFILKIAAIKALHYTGRQETVDEVNGSMKPKPAPSLEASVPTEKSADQSNKQADEEESGENTENQETPEQQPVPSRPEKEGEVEVEYIQDLSTDYERTKKHTSKYPVCILTQEGDHYRIENGGAISHYMAWREGWDYLGNLLPGRRKNPNEHYLYVPIPNDENEARILAEVLGRKKITTTNKTTGVETIVFHVVLTEDEIKLLGSIKKDYNYTAYMNRLQKWAWDNARVFIYWNTLTDFFTMRPQFKKVHFSLPIQGEDGAPPVFEKRKEYSIKHVAKEVPYAKRITKLKDSKGVEFTIEFIITGYCENPYYADTNFKDVFTQNDMNIRGSALKLARGLRYLPQLNNIEAIDKRFKDLLTRIQGEDINPNENANTTPESVSITDHKASIQQQLQQGLLEAANAPENYGGFVFTEVNILNVYPSGDDAAEIIELENDLAQAEQKAQSEYIQLTVTTAQQLAANIVTEDAERKRIAREVDEIREKLEAESEGKEALAAAETKLADVYGTHENALKALEIRSKWEAISKMTGAQLYVGTTATEALTPGANRIITDLTKQS